MKLHVVRGNGRRSVLDLHHSASMRYDCGSHSRIAPIDNPIRRAYDSTAFRFRNGQNPNSHFASNVAVVRHHGKWTSWQRQFRSSSQAWSYWSERRFVRRSRSSHSRRDAVGEFGIRGLGRNAW